MSRPKVRRDFIAKRDDYRCHYCSIDLPLAVGTFDHIWPVIRGGVHANWNLVWACRPCNVGLGSALSKCDCPLCLRSVMNHRQIEQHQSTAGIDAEQPLTQSLSDAFRRAGWEATA